MIVNMGNVWDRATEFLSDNLATILPIALLAIFLPGAISSSIAPFAKQSAFANGAVGLAGLALTLVSLWGQLAITALAIDKLGGRAPAIELANARILPMIGMSLLLLLGAIVLFMPYPIILGFAGYDLDAAMSGTPGDMPDGVGGFLALYTLMLLPLLVFLSARLALLTAVVVRERRGIGAFARSFVLTRGIAWKIVGVIVLYGIVLGVAMLAARTVFGSILQLIVGGDGPITAATVLTAILVSAVQTAFVVLGSAFLGKLYIAVRDVRSAIVDSA